MRLFEMLIIGLLIIGLVIVWIRRRSDRETIASDSRQWVPLLRTPVGQIYFALLAATLAVHLWREGAHWQMYPVYLGMTLVAALYVAGKLRKSMKIVTTVAVALLISLSCCLAAVLPMFRLPQPTGPYSIGTRIVVMTDDSRREDAGNDPSSARAFVAQIWYPAQDSHNARAPYRRRSETSFASSYQSVDWTHARYDAPVVHSSSALPIVIYNPGWNGRRTQDTILTEELASHGYVVIALDHPFNSGPVDLGGGRIIRFTSTPELSDQTSSKEAVYALIDKEVEKDTGDTLYALRRLEEMNADRADQFYQALDLSRVGAMGYSLGAAVAAESAYQSPKIRCVLNLDTPLYGEAGKHGVSQPLLFMGEDLSHTSVSEKARMTFGERRDVEMDEDDYARQLPLFRRKGDYQFTVNGTLHTSFQDGILFSPLKSISGAGSIAPDRMVSILREYTLAFFDQSLRGIPSGLLAGRSSPFAEVSVLFTTGPIQ